MLLEVIIPLVVAIIAALGSYLVTARRMSGTIATSTAEDLWEESRSMRRDLNGRVRSLEAQLGEAQTKIESQSARIDELTDENEQKSREILKLQMDVTRLQRIVDQGGKS